MVEVKGGSSGQGSCARGAFELHSQQHQLPAPVRTGIWVPVGVRRCRGAVGPLLSRAGAYQLSKTELFWESGAS